MNLGDWRGCLELWWRRSIAWQGSDSGWREESWGTLDGGTRWRRTLRLLWSHHAHVSRGFV